MAGPVTSVAVQARDDSTDAGARPLTGVPLPGRNSVAQGADRGCVVPSGSLQPHRSYLAGDRASAPVSEDGLKRIGSAAGVVGCLSAGRTATRRIRSAPMSWCPFGRTGPRERERPPIVPRCFTRRPLSPGRPPIAFRRRAANLAIRHGDPPSFATQRTNCGGSRPGGSPLLGQPCGRPAAVPAGHR